MIVEMEVDKNYIHLLVHYKPTMSVLDLVRWFKQISHIDCGGKTII